MSAFTFSTPQSDWQTQPEHQAPLSYAGHNEGTAMAASTDAELTSSRRSRPLHTSSQSYHCRSGPSRSMSSDYTTPIHLLAEPVSTEREPLTSFSQPGLDSLYSYHPPVTTYGVPGSETGIPTFPRDPSGAEQGSPSDGEMENAPIQEELEGAADDAPSQNTAEGRVDKRRTNRFRLTHSQTRYLMSEFARQAHPDVAQRERLSREIPGLSSRQVQVWFQNRRAKLKRLTSDDRDRTTKSRALPEDFDMTQALHPFSAGSQRTGSPTGPPLSRTSTFSDQEMIEPSMLHALSLQSADESIISPVSMSSAFGDFFSPAGSCSTSDELSPISTTSDRSHFSAFPNSENPSPEAVTPFGRARSFSTAYPNRTPTVPPPLHEVHTRPRDTLVPSIRSSSVYTTSPPSYSGLQPASLRSQSGSVKGYQSGNGRESGRTPFSGGHPNSNQTFQAPSSFRAEPNMMASNSVPQPQPQFASQQRAQQLLPSSHASFLTQRGHEPYWAAPTLHPVQQPSSYQSAAASAPPGSFYALQEPLEQAWLPGTENDPGSTILPLDPDQRWLHYQENTGVVYTGPTDAHGLPDVGSMPLFPHAMDDSGP